MKSIEILWALFTRHSVIFFYCRWEECKQLLMTRRFLESLKFYDRDHIPERKVLRLKEMVSKNMRFEGIETGSKAVHSLRMWVNALLAYHKVMMVVEPLKGRLKSADHTLANVNKITNKNAGFMCVFGTFRPRRLLLLCRRTCLRPRRLWKAESKNTRNLSSNAGPLRAKSV